MLYYELRTLTFSFFNLMFQVAKLSRDVAELEGQLDRAQRDKSSLSKQLEETLCKLSIQEQDRNKVVCVECTFKSPSHIIQIF